MTVDRIFYTHFASHKINKKNKGNQFNCVFLNKYQILEPDVFFLVYAIHKK